VSADDVEGLVYVEEFVSPAQEQDLLAFFDTLAFREVVMRGQAARRTVRHFGLDWRRRCATR
jgi:alkylated DNA repair protein (DNA oxidative demethylase)